MVLDLDPPGKDFAFVINAAALLKELLEETGLVSFPMTTGSNGLHITVPFDRQADFDTTRGFAKDISSILAVRNPDFLDVQRNAYGQTGVAPQIHLPENCSIVNKYILVDFGM